MRTVESTAIDDALPTEALQSVLREHSVQLAILFGSYASGTPHPESDIDIAVKLETTHRDDPAYNEAFFGLSADLSSALGTDDVDLVDIHSLPAKFAEVVFDQGVLLVGDQSHVADLRRQLTETEAEPRSPRDRFDAALAKIDEHLGDSAVTATKRANDDR